MLEPIKFQGVFTEVREQGRSEVLPQRLHTLSIGNKMSRPLLVIESNAVLRFKALGVGFSF